MYWQQSTRYEQAADVMSRDCFELLKKYLHFADNSQRDKCYKSRHLFEILKANSLKGTPEEHISINEQLNPFKDSPAFGDISPRRQRNGASRFSQEVALVVLAMILCLREPQILLKNVLLLVT